MTTEPDAVSRILGVLKQHPEGLNIVEIAQKADLNRMSVAKYLDILTAQELAGSEMFGRAKVYYFAGRRVPAAVFRENIPLHYAITDSDLTVIQLNDYVPRTVGKVGIRLSDMFFGHVVNYDECMAAFRDAVAGRETLVIAERRFPDGPMFCELRSLPIRFPDGSAGMISLSVDITRERLAGIAGQAGADLFRGLVESLPHPVFRAGTDCVLTYLSPRAEEFGLVAGDTGRPFADLAVQQDRKVVDAGLRAVLESGEGTIRFRISGPDGRKLRLEAVCTAQRDPAGTCTGVAGILRDVTGKARPIRKRPPDREG